MKQAVSKFGNEDFFGPDKEIKGLCGDVLLYVAQTRPPIDEVRAKKDRFRMETNMNKPRDYGAHFKWGG